MYDECSIRIRRLQNGYNVTITDPEITKKNRERDKGGDGCCSVAWQDPDVSYAFSTDEEVLTFVGKALKTALPVDEYSSTFDKLAKGKSSS